MMQVIVIVHVRCIVRVCKIVHMQASVRSCICMHAHLTMCTVCYMTARANAATRAIQSHGLARTMTTASGVHAMRGCMCVCVGGGGGWWCA